MSSSDSFSLFLEIFLCLLLGFVNSLFRNTAGKKLREAHKTTRQNQRQSKVIRIVKKLKKGTTPRLMQNILNEMKIYFFQGEKSI